MATRNTRITTGSNERSSAVFSIDDGASQVVYTSRQLATGEYIKAVRVDGASADRPIPDAIVCDHNKQEGRIYGPIVGCKLTISATEADTIVYSDS